MTTMTRSRSEILYGEACNLLPGGVNSPVRAFKAVGGSPIFFERGYGSKLVDVDGNEYIDYLSSWGAVIVGHAHPSITRAVSDAAANGTSFGAPHAGEIRLAREVVARMAAAERVRFVNSGTEATLATIRLARAATDRKKIIKFEGNYHGAVDSLLAKAGSGIATFGIPDSAGVPEEVTRATLVSRYNAPDHVEALLKENRDEVAAVLVEPVAGNMGLVPPSPRFLGELRRLCDAFGALLVFDEVMTGFRIARGGAVERYGVVPDLVCMGKVIGGGLPVGAYGGKKELMNLIAPLGPVYQAGTLSGNPLAMAAGTAALALLDEESYGRTEEVGARLEMGLAQAAQTVGVAAQVQRVASMIGVFFSDAPVTNFDEAKSSDVALFKPLFHALLRRGVCLPPSGLESWFFTTAHTTEDVDRTVEAFAAALHEVNA